jgi:hypothetical protein
MQLNDYYKKYGPSFTETEEFIQHWRCSPDFKIKDNRICAGHHNLRPLFYKKLNTMFNLPTVSDSIHHKILTAYFECLIEYNIIPHDTEFKSHLRFDSDKVRIFNNSQLNFRRPKTLAYPQKKDYLKKLSTDRIIFNSSIFVNDEIQYNLYTVMSNYGSGGSDCEFMKFSYYISNGMFYFNGPKSTDKSDSIITIPVDQLEDEKHYFQFKRLMKIKLFSMFYEDICKSIFRRVISFNEFNDNHLKVLVLLSGYPIKDVLSFMEEHEYVNMLHTLSDEQIVDLYKISLTTFEMVKI